MQSTNIRHLSLNISQTQEHLQTTKVVASKGKGNAAAGRSMIFLDTSTL